LYVVMKVATGAASFVLIVAPLEWFARDLVHQLNGMAGLTIGLLAGTLPGLLLLDYALKKARYPLPQFRRHVAPGFCSCGYDLRAIPSRCPECGAPAPAAASPVAPPG
jgi:hypothetical protein